MLLDDEELELIELQVGPNPLSCSAHFPTSGSHSCSLCKDLLTKFPPSSVAMKVPLSIQPWASSPEIVNKLFKDSLLLGLLHAALLRQLLSDIDKELSSGFFSHAGKNGKYMELLHSLECRGVVLEFWQKSLNLLTWTEILRLVSNAAGFGSKLDMTRKANCSKECDLMDKYGLSPGTLKGELFNILLAQGNSGMEVSELEKSSRIVELNLIDTLHDLEDLIISALISDVTLFERISSSEYRLRIHTVIKEYNLKIFNMIPRTLGVKMMLLKLLEEMMQMILIRSPGIPVYPKVMLVNPTIIFWLCIMRLMRAILEKCGC